ncbi:MAG: hypothetical protein CML24_05795 [Rhizobiales bacterium]|nr:hypothetical protein [Hyphomicrobiales bacterium]
MGNDMTIGILAVGPNAGLAVVEALAAVEKIATGSIGGYAVFAVLDSTGGVLRAQTQRGGTRTLFVDGETTGVVPPDDFAGARFAAIMSSGPDRPDPLSQYVAAAEGVGLVTGHRFSNAIGAVGLPLNLEILEAMRAGLSAQQAVEKVIAANPQADAGIIAADFRGIVHASNTPRVAARPDIGHARREDAGTGAVVEVLHNAIVPSASIAALAAEIAMATMVPRIRGAGKILVRAGTPLVEGPINRVLVDDDWTASLLEVTDPLILSGRHNCAPVYLDTQIVRDGRIVAYTIIEPNGVVDEGRIVSLNGQDACWIPYRAAEN